jgi:superfamily II DNA or RNA helicase
MQKLPARTFDRQRVEARGEPWLVVRREPFDGCALVTLHGTGNDNRGRTLRLLTPFDRLTERPQSTRLAVRVRRNVIQSAAQATADAHHWAEPWSSATARIDFLPWQFEPAMAAISGAMRLLLTDDVGLGKTIQAGLIVAELRARGLISRGLILTPASLRHQWANELRERFALDPLVLDHDELTRRSVQLPVGVNPWTTADIVISSIDLVKRPEVRSALDSGPLDIVVVDEAHHLTPGSDRGAVVAQLAERTTWIVLATATPHSGDAEAFAYLSRIGAYSDAPPVSFRRRARDVGARVARHVHLHRVHPRARERALLDEVLQYARALWRQPHSKRAGPALLAAVISRRSVSSHRALARTLARRRELLHGSAAVPLAQPELPWIEEDDADGAGSDQLLGASRLPASANEIAWLERLIDLAEQAGTSSKSAAVARILSRVGEPAIVFSEYRDTLIDIEQSLSPHFSIATVHGGLSVHERRSAIRRFLEGEVRVLLTTDAAGEGLNLQERCRLVINVELPWNPARLEQRIGRVDRLGQQRRVHAIHLHYGDSFEEHVLARLQRRTRRAADDLQEVVFDEFAVAEAVFEGRRVTGRPHTRLPAQVAGNGVFEAQLRRKAAALGGNRGRSGPSVAVLDPGRPAAGIALLFEWHVHDQAHRPVAHETVCVQVLFAHPVRVPRRRARRWAQAWATSPAVRAVLARVREDRLQRAAAETRVTSSALVERLEAIDRALRARTPLMFQGSLFDRRAEQRAQADRAAVDVLRAHVTHQLVLAHALRVLSSSERPHLIAAWALPGE